MLWSFCWGFACSLPAGLLSSVPGDVLSPSLPRWALAEPLLALLLVLLVLLLEEVDEVLLLLLLVAELAAEFLTPPWGASPLTGEAARAAAQGRGSGGGE